MRKFVRQNRKLGRCNAFNQHYKYVNSDNVFNIVSEELHISGTICEFLDEFFEFLNKFEKELDSKFDDFRDINQKVNTGFIGNKLNMSKLHDQLPKLDLKNTQLNFDGTSLYPSAMWEKNSVYPKTETRFAFKPHMNDVFIEAITNRTFNWDGN